MAAAALEAEAGYNNSLTLTLVVYFYGGRRRLTVSVY